MLFGATVRSPHAAALIRGIDARAALALAGRRGGPDRRRRPRRQAGRHRPPDQPVLAFDRVRHHGEPVAIVAAADPETARRAAALVGVRVRGRSRRSRRSRRRVGRRRAALHPGATCCGASRSCRARRSRTRSRTGRSSYAARYEVGIQDQAFLGPESGLAIPDRRGGVELHIATQWLHVDRDQVAAALGLPARPGAAACWRASAARSARARTCRCSCTPACSRCAPGGR